MRKCPLVAGIGDDDHQGEKYRVSKGQETELGRNVCNCEKSLKKMVAKEGWKEEVEDRSLLVCNYVTFLLSSLLKDYYVGEKKEKNRKRLKVTCCKCLLFCSESVIKS